MNLHLNLTVEYLLALIAGIAILTTPKLLSYIVAIYLIAVGVIVFVNNDETPAPINGTAKCASIMGGIFGLTKATLSPF